jgi:uncharacterized protein (DUF2141 family)
MKNTSSFFIFLFVLTTLIHGQCKLEIEITGLRNDTGLVMLQLLDENKKAVNQAKGLIRDKRSVVVFKELKPGNYAFQYYHDENLSEVMETGMLGKPKEGYGFSNNASGPFGPKPFKEWLFEIKEDMKVPVRIRY